MPLTQSTSVHYLSNSKLLIFFFNYYSKIGTHPSPSSVLFPVPISTKLVKSTPCKTFSKLSPPFFVPESRYIL